MTTHDILRDFRKKAPVSESDMDVFLEIARQCSFRKNETILSQGNTQSPLMLIKKGCVMTYHEDKAGVQHVIQFGQELWWTGDVRSMQEGVPSYYGIKAMADCELLCLENSQFEELISRAPVFERYFRILFQNSLISHQKRIIRNISYTAEKRYREFTQSFPGLELVVPQKYIASYLGITPEFLSKLKSKQRSKS